MSNHQLRARPHCCAKQPTSRSQLYDNETYEVKPAVLPRMAIGIYAKLF